MKQMTNQEMMMIEGGATIKEIAAGIACVTSAAALILSVLSGNAPTGAVCVSAMVVVC